MSIAGDEILPIPLPLPEPLSESLLELTLFISSIPINASTFFFALSAEEPTPSVALLKSFIASVDESIPLVASPKKLFPPLPLLILNPIALSTELKVLAICTSLAIILLITLITGVNTAINPCPILALKD